MVLAILLKSAQESRLPNDAVAAMDGEDGVFPAPVSNDADIQQVEFGGKTGRITTIEGKKGTTTVIWVSEQEPAEAGRSL